MPKAIIVGCNGQDGTLLYKFLEGRNYTLLGIGRNAIRNTEYVLSHPLDIGNTE